MRELLFVVDALLELLVVAFLLRLLFQLVRVDFRNPLAQAILRITNPLIVPLRSVLPPLGRLDTASVVGLLLVQVLRRVIVLGLLTGALPSPLLLLFDAIVRLLDTTLLLFVVAVFLYVVLSWVAPGGYHPAARLLGAFVEPLLGPFRRALPPLGGLDLSPLVVVLLLWVLRMVLNDRIAPLLMGLG